MSYSTRQAAFLMHDSYDFTLELTQKSAQMSSHAMESNRSANSKVLTSCFIRLPTFLEASLSTPQPGLSQGTRGLDNLCQVTEEYRISSRFDVLASIGGLLALLQGFHVFLFGRPLFWGLFGGL